MVRDGFRCYRPTLEQINLIIYTPLMYCTRNMGRLLIMLLASAFILSCAGDSADEKSENPKISKLKLLPDFEVDHLYSPSADENGSWVAMAFDDKGRLITADQYGMLYRLTLSPLGV